MHPLRNILHYTALFLPLLALPGCLITTQSFNHGKLLNPGERIMTSGFGWRYSSRYLLQQTGDSEIDSTGAQIFETFRDSTRVGWLTYTYDYRVGVLRKYPFGRGLETGFHMEMGFRMNRRKDINGYYEYLDRQCHDTVYVKGNDTVSYQTCSVSEKFVPTDTVTTKEPEFYGPPVLEIDTRFGLPDITMRKSIFHHNVNVGWIVGYWVDNGWFAGYAAGWEFTHFIPYLSTRLFLSATDALDESINTNFFTKHERTWGGRLSGGVSCRLPSNFSVIPEFITPELSLTFPNYSTGQRVGFNASLGIRWMLGQ